MIHGLTVEHGVRAGVAYIDQDGMAEPVLVRFTHVTDHHIAVLTQAHAPRLLSAVPGPVQDVA